MADDLLRRNWNDDPVNGALIDDLAYVLASMVVGWKDQLGVDLAQHPEVQRVMARYREFKAEEAAEPAEPDDCRAKRWHGTPSYDGSHKNHLFTYGPNEMYTGHCAGWGEDW